MTSPTAAVATPPGPADEPPAFPAVLKGSQKGRVPPPVPPRGSPKPKRGGGSVSIDTKAGAPPPSCCSTPPPPFEEACASGAAPAAAAHAAACRTSRTNSSSTTSSSASVGRGARRAGASSAASVLTASSASSLALTPAMGGARSHDTSVCWTPPVSAEGSTPTWTEGTPSFTESSCSEHGGPATPARGATPAAAELRARSPRAPPPPARTAAAINCLTSEMAEVVQITSGASKITIAQVELKVGDGE